MNSIYWMIGLYIFFMLVALSEAVFIFPFRKVLINRWKLKIQGLRKEVTPVLIVYKNNSIQEVIVDTSQETFTHDEASYNIRPNKFYRFNTFWYSIYIHNNPEPLDLQIDEKGLATYEVKDSEGHKIIRQVPIMDLFRSPEGNFIAGKVIDGKTYDNLLIRAYNAGMAWMARNSNLLQILTWVIIVLVVISIGVTFWKSGQTVQTCQLFFNNITAQITQVKTVI